jgi:hypothetical protein
MNTSCLGDFEMNQLICTAGRGRRREGGRLRVSAARLEGEYFFP